MIDFELNGPFHGSGSVRIFPEQQQFTRIRFQPERNSPEENSPATSSNSGLLGGQLQIRSGHDRASSTILYLLARENENRHYRYDFDRDGSNEWVLKSSLLRVIVSPAGGGRALALVDKSLNTNLITLGGALREMVVPVAVTRDATTRFCWGQEASPAREPVSADPSQSAPAAHCEEFVPGGKSIAVSSGIRHLEIVTQGRPTLAVDWTPGSATIVPRIFSAQIEFPFPAPAPGEAPLEHTLRYTVLPGR